MKRSLLFAVVTMSLCLLATPALAGNKKKQSNKQESQPSKSYSAKKFGQHLNLGGGSLGSVSNIASQFKKHSKKKHNSSEPKPLDPDKGDGRVPVDPVVPQGRPGFVWVGDHWERAKAPKKITPVQEPKVLDPTMVGPVVRDHRTPKLQPLSNGNGSGGVTVTPTTGGFGPEVRDHRTPKLPPLSNGNGSGGVTVSPTTGGFGPEVRDHRTPKLPTVSTGNGAGGVTVTPTTGGFGPVVRDHRTTSVPPVSSANAPGGVLVTPTTGSARGQSVGIGLPNPFKVIADGLGTVGDKVGIGSGSAEPSAGPIVRDHRTTYANQPNVRDHR